MVNVLFSYKILIWMAIGSFADFLIEYYLCLVVKSGTFNLRFLKKLSYYIWNENEASFVNFSQLIYTLISNFVRDSSHLLSMYFLDVNSFY